MHAAGVALLAAAFMNQGGRRFQDRFISSAYRRYGVARPVSKSMKNLGNGFCGHKCKKGASNISIAYPCTYFQSFKSSSNA